MAQVDASIPLQAAMPQTPDLLGNMSAAQGIEMNQMKIEAAKTQMQQQQLEAEAFKGADFSTPEGRNSVLVNLMQKAPQAGLALMKQFGEMDKNSAEAKKWTAQANLDSLKTTQEKQKVVAQAALPAWNAYEKALKEGKPDQVARAEADKLMPDAISQLNASGVLSPDEVASLPRVFDPTKIGGFMLSSGMTSRMIEDRLKEAQTDSAEATAKEKTDKVNNPEKYNKPRSSPKQLLEDASGNMKQYDPSTGQITDVQGGQGLHKPGTTGGAQQKANIRATTVAASAKNSLRLLDSIQKEYGDKATTSPLFGDEPSGPFGKTVHAAEKLAIPNKKLKLDADAASLIDEAGPAFTGGLRVNSSFRTFLMSQLPSTGDPDEVAQRKWKNFRDNITGASNTFQKAYSGNPDYWSKDDSGKTVDPNAEPAPSAAQSSAPANKPQPRPQPGAVVNGYKFKGGDPNSQANWEKQ